MVLQITVLYNTSLSNIQARLRGGEKNKKERLKSTNIFQKILPQNLFNVMQTEAGGGGRGWEVVEEVGGGGGGGGEEVGCHGIV